MNDKKFFEVEVEFVTLDLQGPRKGIAITTYYHLLRNPGTQP